MPGKSVKSIPLPDGLLDSVVERLTNNKPVRRTLPLRGRIHIDRQLPFLCVYRRPEKDKDWGTAHLTLGEASYLRVSASPRFEKSLSRLVSTVVSVLAPKFGAFLIVEIWAGSLAPEGPARTVKKHTTETPQFNLYTWAQTNPPPTLLALKEFLREIEIEGKKARVKVAEVSRVSPSGLPSLIERGKGREFNCQLMGIEVYPIYRDGKSEKRYPQVRRQMRHGLSLSLKQAFYEFVKEETTHRPAHFHSLGRRAMTRAVLQADLRLSAIVNAFDFNLAITPSNVDLAWKDFKSARYERSPAFTYRPLSVRPADVKRELFQVPLHRIEDPTLADLFEEKQIELDRKLTMLHDRNTPNFLYGSMQTYGRVEDAVFNLANEILETLPPSALKQKRRKTLGASALKTRACAEVEEYHKENPLFNAKVRVRKDISGMLISRGRLLIGKAIRVPMNRVEGLIQHEIGTHLVSHFNGCDQTFQLMRCGLPGYEETQEGLAVLAEYLVNELDGARLRVLAGRARAVRLRTEGAEFIEIFRNLHNHWEISRRMAFLITVRACRSGGFTKDGLYLAGLVKLMNHIQAEGAIDVLFTGKISTNHIPMVEELQWRKILKKPLFRPRFLKFPGAEERLKRIRDGCTVIELQKETIL